jgi:hypothetical protein
VPWAADPSISFLASVDQMASLVGGAGFTPILWEDLTAGVLAWLEERAAASSAPSVATIGLHRLASDMPTKLANQVRNVREGRGRFLRTVPTRSLVQPPLPTPQCSASRPQ